MERVQANDKNAAFNPITENLPECAAFMVAMNHQVMTKLFIHLLQKKWDIIIKCFGYRFRLCKSDAKR